MILQKKVTPIVLQITNSQRKIVLSPNHVNLEHKEDTPILISHPRKITLIHSDVAAVVVRESDIIDCGTFL